jgi:hypothetical protein
MGGLGKEKQQREEAKQAELFVGKVVRAQGVTKVLLEPILFFITGNTRRRATFVLEYHFCLRPQQGPRF